MNRKKIVLLLFACFFLLLSLFVLLSPPKVGVETETSLEKYGRFRRNKYVASTLDASFCGLLPDQQTAQQFGEEYLYHYRCGLLGEATFSIYLSAKMDDSSFGKEKLRVSALTEQSFSADDLQVCFVQGSMDSIGILFDDEILDGYGMFIEIAVLDHSRQEIAYFCGDLDDGLIRHAHTEAFLQDLITRCRGTA